MKYPIAFFLVAFSTAAIAQKTIKLQVTYLADHQYNLDTRNIINMTMDVQADDATKEQLKSSGMAFPIVMDMNQDMGMLMKTGKFNSAKEIPITVEYTRFNTVQRMNDSELPAQPNPLTGMKIKGWGDSKGKFRFETIEGEGVTDQIRGMMSGLTDQMGTQIIFPEKPMKVGDEFTQELPYNMPVQGGKELKMIVKTIYKLISFDTNNALFDTRITMTMDLSVEDGTVTAEGAGKGTMTFDVKRGFLSDTNSTVDMIMKMKMGPMDMDIKSSTKTEMKVTHL